MTWRRTVFDEARVQILLDPWWLLAPLYARDRLARDVARGRSPDPADLPVPEQAWQAWWDGAVAFRPGEAAPSAESLQSGSPGLTRWWRELEPEFREWLAELPPLSDRRMEQQQLTEFEQRNSRAPAARTLTVLVVRPAASLFLRPEPDRLVVSEGLRDDPVAYRPLLWEVFDDFF